MRSTVFKIKEGDTLPDYTATLTDAGSAIDLTTATGVVCNAVNLATSAFAFSRACTGDANGVVTLEWQPSDTATAVVYGLEFVVTWPGSAPQTFPSEGLLLVEVTADNPTS